MMTGVLLLNASYEPLRIVTARKAVELIVTGKAEPVTDSDQVLRSPSMTVNVPVVARLKAMVQVPFRGRVPLTRSALAARDGHRCQVAGCDRRGTTVDHVIPRSRFVATADMPSPHCWENVVWMCAGHNSAKDDRLLDELGWALKRRPVAPRGRLVLLVAAGMPAVPGDWEMWLPAA